MAHPWLSECGFEDGTKGHFDTETDTENRLDFPHYATLAAIPGMGVPYRGAYCMRVTLVNDGSPANALLQETGSWDTSTSGTIYFRFMFWVSADITMANADEFGIFQLWSSTSTVEGGAYINFTTANGLRIGIGETAATSFKGLTTNQWHCLELKHLIDSGGNDGTLDAWLDGSAFTQVATLTQGAITSGIIGVVSQDAGTTVGTVLFDDIVADDARLFPPRQRWPMTRTLTTSGHVFVGPGSVDAAAILSTGASDGLILYDTDNANVDNAQASVVELNNATNVSISAPPKFIRGCYAALSGTNARAQIMLAPVLGPTAYGSDGAIRTYALKRKPRVNG